MALLSSAEQMVSEECLIDRYNKGEKEDFPPNAADEGKAWENQ